LVVHGFVPRLKPIFDFINACSYDFPDMHEKELNDTFVIYFIEFIEHEVLPLKTCLTSTAFSYIFTGFLKLLTKNIERILMNKKFSFWGKTTNNSNVGHIFFSSSI
jgi:hypothetical protein